MEIEEGTLSGEEVFPGVERESWNMRKGEKRGDGEGRIYKNRTDRKIGGKWRT